MAVRQLADGRYVVDGESDATYVVDIERGTCTCPDHQIRGERCKHLRRVAIEINLGRVAPPGSRFGTCPGCDAEIVVDRDASPPHLCPSCRLDPGEFVTDRETGDTLRVVAVGDRRADEVEIPELDTTVAEHPTNREYDPRDLVVEVTYPDAGRSGDRKTYTFPRSRLRPRPPDDRQLTLSDHAATA